MNDLIAKVVLGWIRHAITAGGAGLVTDGYLTGSEMNQVVGALMTIVPIAFSAYDKWHSIQAKQKAVLQAAQTGTIK